MSLSDIPAKIIERLESSSEKNMEIACALTQLIYTQKKNPEDILKTFRDCLKEVEKMAPHKKIIPKPKHLWQHKIKILAFMSVLCIFLVVGCFILRYYLNNFV